MLHYLRVYDKKAFTTWHQGLELNEQKMKTKKKKIQEGTQWTDRKTEQKIKMGQKKKKVKMVKTLEPNYMFEFL